jgi:CBS domain-containing protein
MFLTAKFASDVMTTNPVSVSEESSLQEVVALFTDHHCHVAPVIDVSGRPVGVVSSTDLILHAREHPLEAQLEDSEHEKYSQQKGPEGFSVEVVDPTRVRDLMTPFLITVTVDEPIQEVVQKLVSSKVHHLFVVDEDKTLVGVISTVDVIRHLRSDRS